MKKKKVNLRDIEPKEHRASIVTTTVITTAALKKSQILEPIYQLFSAL